VLHTLSQSGKAGIHECYMPNFENLANMLLIFWCFTPIILITTEGP